MKQLGRCFLGDLLSLCDIRPDTRASDVVMAMATIPNTEHETAGHEWLYSEFKPFPIVLGFAFYHTALSDTCRESQALTSEPIFSPVTTLAMLPRSFRLKMIMGRLLSLQSEMAVESITFSPCFNTSM